MTAVKSEMQVNGIDVCEYKYQKTEPGFQIAVLFRCFGAVLSSRIDQQRKNYIESYSIRPTKMKKSFEKSKRQTNSNSLHTSTHTVGMKNLSFFPIWSIFSLYIVRTVFGVSVVGMFDVRIQYLNYRTISGGAHLRRFLFVPTSLFSSLSSSPIFRLYLSFSRFLCLRPYALRSPNIV